MKAKKHLIIDLITDDLIHAKLTHGLEELGLNPENYTLHLSATVIDLMGFKGERNEYIFEYYLDLRKRARFIQNEQDNKAMKDLARDIYHNLQLQKPLPTE